MEHFTAQQHVCEGQQHVSPRTHMKRKILYLQCHSMIDLVFLFVL